MLHLAQISGRKMTMEIRINFSICMLGIHHGLLHLTGATQNNGKNYV